MGERLVYTQKVIGSSPVPPIVPDLVSKYVIDILFLLLYRVNTGLSLKYLISDKNYCVIPNEKWFSPSIIFYFEAR